MRWWKKGAGQRLVGIMNARFETSAELIRASPRTTFKLLLLSCSSRKRQGKTQINNINALLPFGPWQHRHGKVATVEQGQQPPVFRNKLFGGSTVAQTRQIPHCTPKHLQVHPTTSTTLAPTTTLPHLHLIVIRVISGNHRSFLFSSTRYTLLRDSFLFPVCGGICWLYSRDQESRIVAAWRPDFPISHHFTLISILSRSST